MLIFICSKDIYVSISFMAFVHCSVDKFNAYFHLSFVLMIKNDDTM